MSHTESQRLAIFFAILPPRCLEINLEGELILPTSPPSGNLNQAPKRFLEAACQSDKYLFRLAHVQLQTASLNSVTCNFKAVNT